MNSSDQTVKLDRVFVATRREISTWPEWLRREAGITMTDQTNPTPPRNCGDTLPHLAHWFGFARDDRCDGITANPTPEAPGEWTAAEYRGFILHQWEQVQALEAELAEVTSRNEQLLKDGQHWLAVGRENDALRAEITRLRTALEDIKHKDITE